MIIVLIGPTGSGKSVFELECEKQGLDRVITNTTRERRVGEDANAYNFLTESEFKKKIQEGKLVEYVLYNDNYYGVGVENLTEACVVVLEPKGYDAIKKLYGERVFSIFFEVTEEERMRRARERGDSLKGISERILEDRKLFNEDLLGSMDLVLTNIKIDKIPTIVKKYISIWKE